MAWAKAGGSGVGLTALLYLAVTTYVSWSATACSEAGSAMLRIAPMLGYSQLRPVQPEVLVRWLDRWDDLDSCHAFITGHASVSMHKHGQHKTRSDTRGTAVQLDLYCAVNPVRTTAQFGLPG